MNQTPEQHQVSQKFNQLGNQQDNQRSNQQNNAAAAQLKDLLASDTGKREPTGWVGRFVVFLAISWTLFQIWFASPLPFMLTQKLHDWGFEFNLTIDDAKARSIHLAFALLLCFLLNPFVKRSSRKVVPIADWLLAMLASFCAAYFFLFYDQFSLRQGAPIAQDIAVGVVGIVCLLLATLRALGAPLAIIASLFLLYNLTGPYLPPLLMHPNNSLSIITNHQWITTEGVFGVALSVSTKFVFLFVLFGSLLDRAGAGNYFIQTAFAYLGHFRGGPAKAAVVGSGLSGLISGSSIANVVTTGTFTIPMMKRVGFSAEKAGAVEVASSVNGQLMPPVMGAAAFLMVEYVGVSYVEVVKAAIIPALISYIALFYMVHLEAVKHDMPRLQRADPANPLLVTLLRLALVVLSICLFSLATYYAVNWLKSITAQSMPMIIAALVVLYLFAIRRVAQFADLPHEDPNAPVTTMPRVRETVNTGWHFFIPVFVLIWCLIVERFSPATSAFWGVIVLLVILLTQRPLLAWFRGEGGLASAFAVGVHDVLDSFILAAKNMVAIAVATATAGIIVGVVSQTGVGSVFSDIVETLSGGNILIMLVLVAVLSLILGMGLPTTANYIVVSALLAVVIVEVGRSNGLIIPLIAVHMFVFYFGIMADVTPPVGLASFAAAAISGGAPMKTGLIAFFYSMRTAILPFLFVFNTDLLLIDVGWGQGLWVFVTATIAILLFSAATQGYFFDRLRWYETILLLGLAFAFFRPDFFMNRFSPTLQTIDLVNWTSELNDLPDNSKIRFKVQAQDGKKNQDFYAEFTVPEARVDKGAEALLTQYGLKKWALQDKKLSVSEVEMFSEAEKQGFDPFYSPIIVGIDKSNPQALAKEWLYGLLFPLLIVMIWIQKRRRQMLLLG